MDLVAGTDEYVASLVAERGLAVNTRLAYRSDLDQYLTFLAERGVDRPDTDDVDAFVGRLAEMGLAGSSISRKMAAVRGLHRFLVAEGLASEDPTRLLETPRPPASLPKSLTIDEVEGLLRAPTGDEPAPVRDRALLETLYATGARVSEVVGLDTHDVDRETRTVLLTGKGDKQRVVPLGTFALDAIGLWRSARRVLLAGRPDPGALFLNLRGRRLTRQGVWLVIRRAARMAGLEEASVSPHVLRHSAATHMVEGGADLRVVQELLGHASINTTQVYTRMSPRHLHEVYRTSHPRS